MDESGTREHIQRHAQAVQDGDFDTVVGDLAEELKPQAPTIAQTLPQPVTKATVVSVDFGDEEAVALINYAGDTKEVTIRSHWRELDGRPTIVHAEPTG
jgi:hypothetical protein